MRRIYQILKVLAASMIGIFIGTSIYQYMDYKRRPGLYALNSAPWYTGIQVMGIFTGVILVVLVAAMWVIRRKMRRINRSLPE